jgi:hypothetical protein
MAAPINIFPPARQYPLFDVLVWEQDSANDYNGCP